MSESIKNILDKLNEVKQIKPIYKNMVTILQASEYYEVSSKTIETILKRNYMEFCEHDIIVISGKDLIKIKQVCSGIDNRTPKLTLISMDGLFKMAFMLKDSVIANTIKNKNNMPYTPRKEIVFKSKLDTYLNLLKQEYVRKRKEISNVSNINLEMFNYETQKQFGSNRVDFYFPYMNTIVEYDEVYHDIGTQRELDSRRSDELLMELEKNNYGYSCEIIDDVEFHYISDAKYIYFDAIKSNYNCCEYTKENFTTNRNEYICDKCGYADISKVDSSCEIIRIKYGKEDVGLIKLIASIMSESVGV